MQFASKIKLYQKARKKDTLGKDYYKSNRPDIEAQGLEIRNVIVPDPNQKMGEEFKLNLEHAIEINNVEKDNLQLLVRTLLEEDHEKAYNILKQVFDE